MCGFIIVLLMALPFPGASVAAPYTRAWVDSDGDCQDSRQEALIAQSTAAVRFEDERNCRVAAGRWISPYTGKALYDPARIDIDHVVPLSWAWEHGASQWAYDQWIGFVNDPINLQSVEASINRQKGSKGLDSWLPPLNACPYILRFLRVVRLYRLELDAQEQRIYTQVRSEYCDD